MSTVDFLPLERVSDLDLKLLSRLPRRELDRLAVYLTARPTLYSPTGPAAGAASPYCLGGLEVTPVSGSTIWVTLGALVCANPDVVTEDRPVTWSGMREPDDGGRGIFVHVPVSGNYTAVTPAVPIPGPLPAYEWWTVYARPFTEVAESDSGRKVFNEGTGVFDAASAPKVHQHRLALGIVRGAPGGVIPDPPNATDVPIAWLFVPAGADDLLNALVFDCRKLLLSEHGPNVIGGQWECPLDGEHIAPYTDPVWRGKVWARIGGEYLYFASPGALLANLLEPGISWPAVPNGGAGRAYLYLCKVKGLVPRLRRVGTQTMFSNEPSGQGLSDGWLVLSPTPPKGGHGEPTGGGAPFSGTGYYWDMRPSAALALPGIFAGVTPSVDDCICVGMMVYHNNNGASANPILMGPVTCDKDGWLSGHGWWLNAVDTLGIVNAEAAYPTQEQVLYARVAPIRTAGGKDYFPPFTALRALPRLKVSTADAEVEWWDGPSVKQLPYQNGADHLVQREVIFTWPVPGAEKSARVRVSVPAAKTIAAAYVPIVAVRLPYGEPLVT